MFPDLIPKFDGTQDLGSTDFRWRTLFSRYLQDGTTVIPVSDIATKADLSALSVLPPVTSADNGKYLGVRDAKWSVVPAPPGILPLVTDADDGKYLTVYNGVWVAMYSPVLPPVTLADEGMILKVVMGNWVKTAPPPMLPTVSTDDNGKLLTVIGGVWTAANPPSDVLPPVTLADHGSVLIAMLGQWTKQFIGLATRTSEGMVPRLPGTPGRILSGTNTWVPTLTGASGQFKIGDKKATTRVVEHGWLACNGTAIDTSNEAYKALYIVLGGTEAGWDNNDPILLPNEPGVQIRYLPDSKAPAEMGLLIDVPGTNMPSGRVHFELEVYRTAKAYGTPVLTSNTLFKVNPQITFESFMGPITSSSPGWFWYDADNEVWRMFSSSGETAGLNSGRQVLVDFAEVPLSSEQKERMTPGSYYYRVRQLTVVGGTVMATGAWKWGRILSTGGMNQEESLLTKLCDVFDTGRPQNWKLPISSASLTAVTLTGMLYEGAGLTPAANGDVVVDAGGIPNARISILGQGYLMNREEEYSWVDREAVIPQYTNCRTRASGVTFVEIANYMPAATGWSAIAVVRPGQDGFADRGTQALFLGHNAAYNRSMSLDTRVISSLSFSFTGGYGATDVETLGFGLPSGTGHRTYIPPRLSGGYYKVTGSGLSNVGTITHPDLPAWSTPYFQRGVCVDGVDYFTPGESSCVYEVNTNTFYPIPQDTIFRGGRAVVVGGDGKIYCMPRFTWSNITLTTSTGILVFDPVTKEMDYIHVPWTLGVTRPDASGWRCGHLLRDGRLFFTPYSESQFVLVDPQRKNVMMTKFGQSYSDTAMKWYKSFVMADGSVCGFGSDQTGAGTQCFRFDPEQDKLTLFNFPRPITSSIRAAAVLPDGGILMASNNLAAADYFYIAYAGDMPFSPCTASPLLNIG